MPWVKGQSGNPSGRARSPRLLTDSLRKVLREKDQKGVTNYEHIARRLIALAHCGDMPTMLGAVKLIYERIDGKVPDQVQLGNPDGSSLAVPILPDYRAALAGIATRPERHPLAPGEAEDPGDGPAVG